MSHENAHEQSYRHDRQPFWLATTEAQVALLKLRQHANLTHLPPVPPAEESPDKTASTESRREEL